MNRNFDSSSLLDFAHWPLWKCGFSAKVRQAYSVSVHRAHLDHFAVTLHSVVITARKTLSLGVPPGVVATPLLCCRHLTDGEVRGRTAKTPGS